MLTDQPKRSVWPTIFAGVVLLLPGCGDDPLWPLPEMARDAADDAHDARDAANELIENPERLKRTAKGWKNGPPRLGK